MTNHILMANMTNPTRALNIFSDLYILFLELTFFYILFISSFILILYFEFKNLKFHVMA